MSDPLQQPLTLPCGATLPNRIAKAAMTEGLADERLRATERHNRLYRLWSEGGAGLLITGNVQIDRRVLERPGNVCVDSEEGRDRLRAWAEAGTVGGGNHLWMQIAHAGRQSPNYVTREPLAPSEVPLKILGAYAKPRAMTGAEIEDFIGRFAHVSAVARETGFTGVQLHAAHGYLLSDFLTPRVNKRTDEWGGSPENRARFLLETVKATRKAVGDDFPISVKLNSTDFQKGGFTQEESLQVIRWLNEAGVDLLEISGGSYEQPGMVGHRGKAENYDASTKASTVEREAYFLEYAKAVRDVATVPLMVTGGFRSRRVMEQALADGDADIIGIGRPLVTDPHFVKRLFEGTVDAADTHERDLTIGSGLFGPQSRWFAMKFLNIFGMMGWYYMQILRLGDGREPNLKLGALGGLLGHFRNEFRTARRIKPFQKELAKEGTR
ncbi:oxidoreductase FAD/FMN-binding protein [Salinisphaera sp. PC39]|uniref:NADH:flavin oxidoreductase/NADH oxidase family protein n=1 Tax=Salinisphaera sp. PC39 TaxID=1304156 RepID=UPI00333F1F3C